MEEVHVEDYLRLKEIIETIEGQELNEVSNLNPQGLKHLLSIFQDMTYSQVSEFVKAKDLATANNGAE